ncbi:hypothetical protein LSH36_13g11033 [Paralvinella palmiformis]|uniref:Uncharacterized protein n=1 Tax=Paralvinella palmiformis TaxID=53620 RepID=A0AAD9KCZ8_9ANNE|nr:hypothetical protein LSH36_13g11033 [Paralvinella palmiformis]
MMIPASTAHLIFSCQPTPSSTETNRQTDGQTDAQFPCYSQLVVYLSLPVVELTPSQPASQPANHPAIGEQTALEPQDIGGGHQVAARGRSLADTGLLDVYGVRRLQGEHPGRLRTIPLSSILVRAHVHEYVHMYVNVIEISGENLDTDLSNQSRSSIQCATWRLKICSLNVHRECCDRQAANENLATNHVTSDPNSAEPRLGDRMKRVTVTDFDARRTRRRIAIPVYVVVQDHEQLANRLAPGEGINTTPGGAPGYFVARIRNPRGPIPVGGYLFIRLLPRLGAIRSSVLSGNNAIFASSACCQSTDRVKVESTTTKFDLGCLFVSVTDETQIGQFEVAVR